MNKIPDQIIKLIQKLNKEQLLELNHLVINTLKTHQKNELIQKATQFKVRDIVFFHDNDNNKLKRQGVVIRINQQTITVVTTESYKINVPAIYLHHEPKPSKALVKLRDELFPSQETLLKLLK